MSEKKKILIAEDEEDVVFVIKAALEKAGYEVIPASDGEQALQMISKEKPDLVLLDIMMPKLDGYSVNVQIRSNPETKNIPVIIVTGRGQMREVFELNKEAPINDFLEKPFRISVLVSKIEALLNQ